MSGHPEATPEEVFVGNTEKGDARLNELKAAGMKKARFGNVAYDINDKPLPDPWRPLLIGLSERDAYSEHMMVKTFGPDWRRRIGR